MKKYKLYNLIIMTIFIINSIIFANGNLSRYELGTAMYRELNIFVGLWENHWHTACFNYFKMDLNSQMGTMYYTEAQGINHPITGKSSIE